ncbi:helix-turn-helix domain-containing protein [Paenibacillus puerhi]|uniref:helix-turn-helix domain-containing protein n=1 Tax=Paenibacillus puerhi TaxID=2692622 RepID=UPI00135CB898|nr:helix-turn-helix domain-containing protein [Paenibacillus puerhi]
MSNQRADYLTLHDAMHRLGVSRSTFDRWRRMKQLPYIKIGKEIWIDPAELERWVKYHASGVPYSHIRSSSGSIGSLRPEAETITVGYQSGAAHTWTALLMKELGWFEEELAKLTGSPAVQVRWLDSTANGPVLLKGLIGGSIQLASLGDYPMALGFGLSRLLPDFRPLLLAFDGKTAGGQGISLVLRRGLTLRGASQLTGLKLYSVAQSSGSRRISRLLQELGGGSGQLEHREMNESMAALVERQVDGCVLTEPYLSLVRQHGTGQVLFPEGIGGDYLTGLIVDESWALHHRPQVVAYLKAHLRVHLLMREEPARAAKLIARIKGLPASVVARIMEQVRWDAALYSKDLQTLERLYRENSYAEGHIGGMEGDIRYASDYLQQAAKALKLPLPVDQPFDGEWLREQL